MSLAKTLVNFVYLHECNILTTCLCWAGTELCIYRGSCSRCQDVVPKCEPGPVALSAERNEVALAFLLCRPCLNWLVGR